MSEDVAKADKPRRRWYWWLQGRASRRDYWLNVALIFLLGFGLSYVPGFEPATTGLTVVLMFVQIRRLHDFGRTGWLAVVATVAPLLVMLPLMSLTDIEIAGLVGLAVEFAMIVWIGSVKGDSGENRFGPPPPVSWRYMLLGR